MMDYAKLKLAHELANNYSEITCHEVIIEHHAFFRSCFDENFILSINKKPELFKYIDGLIGKLLELIQKQYHETNYSQKEHHHESDDMEHVMNDEGGHFSMKKCKNCHLFYL
ncbi:MAG: hypothetical protein CK424_00115 [Legionella sp.]|nr:MAG: hypothetical protein CK424_00115 [Legionella sp.]